MPKLNQADTARGGSLLLIESDAKSAQLLVASLTECLSGAPEIVTAPNGRQALTCLRSAQFDIILADLSSLGDISERTEDVVGRLVKLAHGALVLALSDGASVSSAVAAMRAGAHDYAVKPLNGPALAARIGEMAERHGKCRTLSVEATPHIEVADFAGFIGGSSAMQFVYEQIERIAASAAPVFITGESGTGKDLCAEALHSKGLRTGKPIIAVNCAAIPRDLMESELFGVARGAFTGAHEDRKGAAELADGGTLFLDEIGEMDLSLQSKLLRFLQTGALSRLGEAGVRQVDVRVICATNRNPMQLISEKKFREDLFYRLHVLPIHLPPLRQRPTDVLVLARHFLGHYGQEERKTFAGFSPEAANWLVSGEWPGNVRQLQNLVRRLVVMYDGGQITASMAKTADVEGQHRPAENVPAMMPQPASILPMWQQEQRIIENAIVQFGGNISMAAAALEISPSTIYRKRQSWADLSRVA
ncbi:sigma-54 dependent transcriptional regulator [Devosia algicola]|uniref:Sigma-54 dependent transcriptional regulator n=1 Tax=Devosia algicola TaxID=3026418 RepID=A0ABY7YN44_9HYPH|nr:sigma-54 dependent transcriptional regulator [Devosia algicola]WDR02454.1 sigma-54 dependent transcriptional regulator [Devosia algicola]